MLFNPPKGTLTIWISIKMIIKKIRLFLIIPILLSLSSCDECKDSGCVSTDIDGKFRIRNTEGDDLLFGEKKIYELDSLDIYTMSGSVKTRLSRTFAVSSVDSTDSVLVVDLSVPDKTIYIDHEKKALATLTLGLTYDETQCCGRTAAIRSIVQDNTTDLGDPADVMIIRK